VSKRSDNILTTTDLNPVFTALDCSANEAAVYLSALHLGLRSAATIAQHAGLKRPNTYALLATLIQRGLIRESKKDGVTLYKATTPSVLLEQLKERETRLNTLSSSLEQILPDLLKLKNDELAGNSVTFVKGSDGVKNLYEETLREPKATIYAIADFDSLFPHSRDPKLHEWMWRYSKRRAKLGILYCGIVNQSRTSDRAYRHRKGELRELRMLKNIELLAEINIFGNKVAFMSTRDEMWGAIIDSPIISTTLRAFHQAIWGLLPPYRL
jgi:sugar-specific transcriptional regulator TrmB